MNESETASGDQQKSAETILKQEIESGLHELERPADGLLLSSFSGGLDIGFGPLLMAVVLTLTGTTWGDALTTLLVANMYAVGFLLVVLGRSELFTEHTTRAVVPVLDGQASLRQLGRLWALVYVGNIVGSSIFAVGMVWFAPAYGIAEPAAFGELARNLTDHGSLALLAGAVLAGWLMGLLSWLVTAARGTTSRIFFVWLITTVIGIAHLPHSIAGNTEVLAGFFATSGITFLDYVRFLSLSTLGNVIGGSTFVALFKYAHAVRSAD